MAVNPPSRALPGMAVLAAQGRPPVRRGRPVDKTLENALASQILALKLPQPIREHKFALEIGRKWRFDFAWPDRMVALEIEGGGFVGGRHGRGVGMGKDCEKFTEAAIMGWRVLRVDGAMVRDGRALRYVWRMLGGRDAYRQAAATGPPPGH